MPQARQQVSPLIPTPHARLLTENRQRPQHFFRKRTSELDFLVTLPPVIQIHIAYEIIAKTHLVRHLEHIGKALR